MASLQLGRFDVQAQVDDDETAVLRLHVTCSRTGRYWIVCVNSENRIDYGASAESEVGSIDYLGSRLRAWYHASSDGLPTPSLTRELRA